MNRILFDFKNLRLKQITIFVGGCCFMLRCAREIKVRPNGMKWDFKKFIVGFVKTLLVSYDVEI